MYFHYYIAEMYLINLTKSFVILTTKPPSKNIVGLSSTYFIV